MDSSALQSPLYLFEKFEAGIVQLNAQREVVAMNDYARRVLPVDRMKPFDRFVLDFHPERSRPKVNFLLDQASVCPVTQNVPMTMIINIPEQVLLIKVTRMTDTQQRLAGFVLVFYDVTQLVAEDASVSPSPSTSSGTLTSTGAAAAGSSLASQPQVRQLSRIPMVANNRVAFVDTHDVRCIESEGHYSRILAPDGWHFCNLSISDLFRRLDPEQFLRVHRCFIVNLSAIDCLERVGGKTVIRLLGDEALQIPVARGEASALRDRLGLRHR